jgi:hypothetical protein
MFVGDGHGTVSASFAGRSGRLPPLSQKYEPGLAASRRIDHTVALQIASLSDAAIRPPTNAFTGVSSVRASWTVPNERPRLRAAPPATSYTTPRAWPQGPKRAFPLCHARYCKLLEALRTIHKVCNSSHWRVRDMTMDDISADRQDIA